jgi:hypothetical protein
MEEYKDIADFPDYQVSNLGNVRSNKRQGQILSQSLVGTKGGQYYGVNLYHNLKRGNNKVHLLVAKTFIPNPENKPTIDHIDQNKLNNNVENLRWATYSEQCINRDYPKSIVNERNIGMFRNKFRVQISRNHNRIYRDGFKTLDEAKAWRDEQLLLF